MKKLYRFFGYVFAIIAVLLWVAVAAGPRDTPIMQETSNVLILVSLLFVFLSWRIFKGAEKAIPKFTTKQCPECDATLSLEAEVCAECEAKQKKGDVTCGSGITSTKDARSYFAEQRRQAKGVGSTEYIWRTSKDGGVCERCRSMDGKRVPWDEELPGGHAGAVARCRCYPEPVIK